AMGVSLRSFVVMDRPGRAAGRRSRSVRLTLESLENRWVQSATGLVSATTNAAGQAVVFAVDRNGGLWENNPSFVASNRSNACSNALRRQWESALERTFRNRNLSHEPGQDIYVRDPVLYDDFLAGWTPLTSSKGITDPSGFTQISASRNERGQPVVFG